MHNQDSDRCEIATCGCHEHEPATQPLSRRRLLGATVAGAAVAMVAAAGTELARPSAARAQTSMTPDEALKTLMDGNQRYVDGKMMSFEHDLELLHEHTAEKQEPFAAVLDDSRESLVMAMLYRGRYDINTEDPKEIDAALADLLALIPICNPKVNITGYQTLPQGASWLNQNWSGQMLSSVFAYLPKDFDPSLLQYWAAPKGKGPIQNDMWVVCSTTKKPVLAHLWLNFLLDQQNAYDNFVNFTGYQPPQNAITADSLIAGKLIPPNLRTAVMSPDDFGPTSLQESALTSTGLKLWQTAYAKFNSGG